MQFAPLPVYERWWAITEACSGATGSLRAVTFYQVPEGSTLLAGSDASAYWSSASNRIVMLAEDTLAGPAVRHEMLHALLRVPGHPRSQFLGRCAGVVDCASECIADAGPPPPADPLAAIVPPESLQVSAALEPLVAGIANPPGFFTVSVSARNPTNHPVVVKLPAGTQSGISAGFQVLVFGSTGGLQHEDLVFDTSSWTFAPGEIKRRLFDFLVGQGDVSNGVFPAGPTDVYGSYGRYRGTSMSFTLPQQ